MEWMSAATPAAAAPANQQTQFISWNKFSFWWRAALPLRQMKSNNQSFFSSSLMKKEKKIECDFIAAVFGRPAGANSNKLISFHFTQFN